MSATVTITSSSCAETDSQYVAQVSNASFDVGAFSAKVNESFAYFDLSSIPSYAIVSSAVLKLRQYDGVYFKAPITLRAAPCTNYIPNTSVTWSNKPVPSALVYTDLPISGNTNSDQSWTIIGNLNSFRINNCLIIKVYALNTSAGDENAKGFRPSTYSTASYRPHLALTYNAVPIKIANDPGSIDRQVVAVRIANDAGAIDRAVVGMKIAPTQGGAFRTVF